MYSFSVELCVLTNVCNHVTAITAGLWTISPSDFTLFSLLIVVSISSIQTCKGLTKSVRDYHQIAFSNPISSTSNILCNTAVFQSLRHIWLCDPRGCNMAASPVLHRLSELTQTHVHWVSGVIQPPHPPSPFPSVLQDHVNCAWSVTWSVHDQLPDQCMISHVTSAW